MSDAHLGPQDPVRHALLSNVEIEQTVAEYKDVIGDMVISAREHKTRCRVVGCPGQEVILAAAELIKKGPDMALTALGLCVTFLAEGETFVAPVGHPLRDRELEEMLSG